MPHITQIVPRSIHRFRNSEIPGTRHSKLFRAKPFQSECIPSRIVNMYSGIFNLATLLDFFGKGNEANFPRRFHKVQAHSFFCTFRPLTSILHGNRCEQSLGRVALLKNPKPFLGLVQIPDFILQLKKAPAREPFQFYQSYQKTYSLFCCFLMVFFSISNLLVSISVFPVGFVGLFCFTFRLNLRLSSVMIFSIKINNSLNLGNQIF